MSKLGRYSLSNWCRIRTTSPEAELDRIIIYSYIKCNRTNECSGQSKQSEFTRLASILRYVSKLDIVIAAISYFAINHSLRSILGEELSMNLSRFLGSKRKRTVGKASKASSHDLCHLFGMHQGQCCHEPILALLAWMLATLNNQRSICSM